MLLNDLGDMLRLPSEIFVVKLDFPMLDIALESIFERKGCLTKVRDVNFNFLCFDCALVGWFTGDVILNC